MLAISAKLVVSFPHASVNMSLQTSPRTFSSTYKALNVVVNLALRIVSKSLIPPLGYAHKLVKAQFIAPFNNMRTLKFKGQPTNAFSLPSIRCLAAPPSFRLLPSAQ